MLKPVLLRYFFYILWVTYPFLAQASNITYINQGEFKFLTSTTHAEPSSWQPISLPDNWNKSYPNVGGIGIYRFDWELQKVPDDLWALLLTRVSNQAAIFINGKLLNKHGTFSNTSLVWNVPCYTTIPSKILHVGHNSIEIKVAAKANYFGRLLPLQLAPSSILKTVYQSLYFQQVLLSQIFATLAFTLGIFLSFIWWYRKEPIYGWFSLASLSWTFYSLYFFVTNLPFPLAYWVRFCFSSHFIMLSAILLFFCHFLDWKHTLRDQLILAYALLMIILLLAVPDIFVFQTISWIVTGYVIMYGILIWAFFKALYHEKHRKKAMLGLICTGVNLMLGIHDWANLFFVLNQPYLLHYGQPLIFIMMGYVLLKSYMQALNISENHNQILDQRIQERELELKQSLEKTRQADHEKVLLKERERIMADIHDGVGGHLVSALAVAESSASKEGDMISETVHQALDELRLVIDSLDPDEKRLPQMLASFRHRYDQRLQAQGIKVSWHFEDLNQCEVDKALQLLRILQELITNIIKHAQASEVNVSATIKHSETGAQYQLSVIDNGKGFEPQHVSGRGLGNLKRRVASMEGQVQFISQNPGTTVNVFLPI